jgi:hypothetical protein
MKPYEDVHVCLLTVLVHTPLIVGIGAHRMSSHLTWYRRRMVRNDHSGKFLSFGQLFGHRYAARSATAGVLIDTAV